MSKFSKLVDNVMNEVAPKGWEKTVKKMKGKKDIKNPWALAHWMKGEGYEPSEDTGDDATPSPEERAKRMQYVKWHRGYVAAHKGQPPEDMKRKKLASLGLSESSASFDQKIRIMDVAEDALNRGETPEDWYRKAEQGNKESSVFYKQVAATMKKLQRQFEVKGGGKVTQIPLGESTRFKVGDRVSVTHGSGVDSGKAGTVVNPREVKTDGRLVPTNIRGAYKPVDWKREVAVRLDNGELITMFKNRLIPEQMGASSEGETANYVSHPADHQLVDESYSDEDFMITVWRAYKSLRNYAKSISLQALSDSLGIPLDEFIQDLERSAHYLKGKHAEFAQELLDKWDAEKAEDADIPSRDDPRWNETAGTNITRSGPGTGTPHSPWVSNDAFNFESLGEAEETRKLIMIMNQNGELLSRDGRWRDFAPFGSVRYAVKTYRRTASALPVARKLRAKVVVVPSDESVERYVEAGGKVIERRPVPEKPGYVSVSHASLNNFVVKDFGRKVSEKRQATLATHSGDSNPHKDWEPRFSEDPKDGGVPGWSEPGRENDSHTPGRSGIKGIIDFGVQDNMKDAAYRKSGKRAKTNFDTTIESSIRINHVTKGKGTVLHINEEQIVIDWDNPTLRILGPERLPLSETKYLIRFKEEYSTDPDEVTVGTEQDSEEEEKKMSKKKQKVDEAMMEIKPTLRDSGDGYKLPVIELSAEDIGLVNEYDLPDPGDSVLTGQDQTKTPKIEPLSTERGADSAHDDIYPDGDYGKDLVPDDAPDSPNVEELGDEAGNPRNTQGDGEPAADVSSNTEKSDDIKANANDDKGYGNDSDDSDDDEDKKMKESDLSWEDIGLNLQEMMDEYGDMEETCEGCGDEDMYSETHDTASGEVGLTPGLLKTLLQAVRDQSPDDGKLEYICTGISEASREKGATLDEGDIGMIMGEIREAAAGGADLDADQEVAGAHAEMDTDTPSSVGEPDAYEGEGKGEDNEAGDVRHHDQGDDSDDDEGTRDDEHGDEAEDNDGEYEDRAEGDMKPTGDDGGGAGEEHAHKRQLMGADDEDSDGKEELNDGKGYKKGSEERKREEERRQERKDKQKRKYGEAKGSKSIKPVSQNTSKGSGPGGGNVSDDGQEMLIPAMAKGSQRGTPGTPLSKEGGGRTVKPVSESRVAVGMAGIGYTDRGAHKDEEDLTEEEKELRMIKRRAGLADWWK